MKAQTSAALSVPTRMALGLDAEIRLRYGWHSFTRYGATLRLYVGNLLPHWRIW